MKTPLKLRVSASNPVLILMSNYASRLEEETNEFLEQWESLDAEIRSHVVLQVEGARGDDFARPERLARCAQEAGIQLLLQVQGNNGDPHITMPYDRARRLLDRYPCIVGVQIAEASQCTFADHPAGPEYSIGRNARFARDIIRLAGEYGVFMSFELMRENYAAIGCSGDNELLFDTIREYGDYVIPMHEMNCEFCKVIDHLGAMALWLSGTTAQWGVEAQSWYWYDSGYGNPGCFGTPTSGMPGGMGAILYLLGASAGASAYAVQPPRDIWSGPAAWRFREWLLPTFKRLAHERLIPTREEVLATTPVAYHLPHCRRPADFRKVLRDLDYDHDEGRLIRAMDGVYDRARDAEVIPNNPRYGWIPLLPAKTPADALARFERVLRPGDLESVNQARTLLDEYFPPTDCGNGWSRVVGPLAVGANSHENWYVPQTIRLGVRADRAGFGYGAPGDRHT